MADRLKPFLRAGERVIYRTPRPWPPRYRREHGLTLLVLGLGQFALYGWAAFDWGALVTPPALILIIMVVLISVGTFLRKQGVEVAVTDQRVLGVDTTEEDLKFAYATSIRSPNFSTAARPRPPMANDGSDQGP